LFFIRQFLTDFLSLIPFPPALSNQKFRNQNKKTKREK
jgi:hypothetical protein